MYNIFHILLLEQDIIKKERIDKPVTELELEAGNSKDYELGLFRIAPSTSESQIWVSYQNYTTW